MKEIIGRFQGAKTAAGHELRLDQTRNGLMIWYLFWGEYRGVDDHHHMGIAQVREKQDSYEIDRFEGNDPQPYETLTYSTLDEVIASLEQEIAKR